MRRQVSPLRAAAMAIAVAFILLFFVWAIGRAADHEAESQWTNVPELQQTTDR